MTQLLARNEENFIVGRFGANVPKLGIAVIRGRKLFNQPTFFCSGTAKRNNILSQYSSELFGRAPILKPRG